MYEYGNARIAARRSRLLDAAALDQLAQSGSAAGALAQLERRPGWRELLRAARQVAGEPAAMLELAIDRFRATELAALPTWYQGAARPLVEALVMDLDRERVLAIVRRRRAGQDAKTINPTITGGALLRGDQLADLARQPTLESLVVMLARLGVITTAGAREVSRAVGTASPSGLETALGAAWVRARLLRAAGRSDDARRVRQLLADEKAERETVHVELGAGGPGVGALVERSLRLARLDRLAAAAHRDPLGIGTVAAYVAAVEAQAIRLRTVLARLAAGWTAEVARSYLAGSEI